MLPFTLKIVRFNLGFIIILLLKESRGALTVLFKTQLRGIRGPPEARYFCRLRLNIFGAKRSLKKSHSINSHGFVKEYALHSILETPQKKQVII